MTEVLVPTLSEEDFWSIEEDDDAETGLFLVTEIIHGTNRWSTEQERIYHRKSDDTYWSIDWQRAATENQEHELDTSSISQVWPHEVTEMIYKTKPPVPDTRQLVDISGLSQSSKLLVETLLKVKPTPLTRKNFD